MELAQIWFGFKGRINRAKYWLVLLVSSAIFVTAVLIAFAAQSWALGILAGLLLIPTLVSSLAVATKRLHDREKSAWWLLVFYLLPALLDGIANVIGDAGLVFSLASFGVSVWALVELGCLRGTIGDNQYGPDPLAGRG
jgi:uncharacterized membrane protein YhaH (DUF805 family)